MNRRQRQRDRKRKKNQLCPEAEEYYNRSRIHMETFLKMKELIFLGPDFHRQFISKRLWCSCDFDFFCDCWHDTFKWYATKKKNLNKLITDRNLVRTISKFINSEETPFFPYQNKITFGELKEKRNRMLNARLESYNSMVSRVFDLILEGPFDVRFK